MKRTAALIAAICACPHGPARAEDQLRLRQDRELRRIQDLRARGRQEGGRPAHRQADQDRDRSGTGREGPDPSRYIPNVLVTYHVAFDKKQDITAYSTGMGGMGMGYRWGGGWGTTDVRVNEILVGTLVIDVADATKKEMVWRGMGVREVDVQAKADKRDKNINSAVKKILKNFPPTSK